MRPLIGIPCHAAFRAETGRPIYANNRAYIHAVEDAGGLPVLIPMLNDLKLLDTLLARLDWLSQKALGDPTMHDAVVLPQLHVLLYGNRRGV